MRWERSYSGLLSMASMVSNTTAFIATTNTGQAGCGEGVRVVAGAVHRDRADRSERAVEGGRDLQLHAEVSGLGGEQVRGPPTGTVPAPAEDLRRPASVLSRSCRRRTYARSCLSAYTGRIASLTLLRRQCLVAAVRAEAHRALDAGAVVPGPVEQHDLPGSRRLGDVAVEVLLAQLGPSRLRQCDEACGARIEVLQEPPGSGERRSP
jgi:hypothetical protein